MKYYTGSNFNGTKLLQLLGTECRVIIFLMPSIIGPSILVAMLPAIDAHVQYDVQGCVECQAWKYHFFQKVCDKCDGTTV